MDMQFGRQMDNYLYSLIYVSKSQGHLDDLERVKLIKQSTEGNARLGITGALVYKPGSFMQLIEGDMAALQKLYRKIRRDKRHHAVKTVSFQSTEQRLFSNYFMAYRDVRQLHASSACHQYFQDDFDFESFIDQPDAAVKFLKAFNSKHSSITQLADTVDDNAFKKTKVSDEKVVEAKPRKSHVSRTNKQLAQYVRDPKADMEAVKAVVHLIYNQAH